MHKTHAFTRRERKKTSKVRLIATLLPKQKTRFFPRLKEEEKQKTKKKMKRKIVKSISLLAVTLGITVSFIVIKHESPFLVQPDPMARSFVLWLHGLGDSGPANEPIKSLFTSAVYAHTKWSFPSALSNPVSCNSKPAFVPLAFVKL